MKGRFVFPKGRVVFFAAVLAVAFISLGPLSETIGTPVWWDTAWHFRAGVDVDASSLSRQNWPVEVDVNFTDLIRQRGATGTFDINSTRVVEHNSTGGVRYVIPSQFDTGERYNASSNAVGTMIFLLNGTTPPGTTRYFYIYFDTIENGAKSPATYPTTLNYSWDGEEFIVNNTYFIWKADTIRGENTSGFYDVRGRKTGNIIMRTVSAASKTKEYTQFLNGTSTLMFAFGNNATFKSGPLRLTVTQRGNEAYWNDPTNATGEGLMVKKYIFYENVSWIRIDQNYTNLAGGSSNRSSTYGGALSLNELNSTEFLGAFYYTTIWGNSTNPASWFGASNSGSYGVGIVNENQSGTQNYYVIHNQTERRIGASLNSTTISAGQSILQRTAMNFNDTEYNQPTINTFRDNIASPPSITILSPESLAFEINASSDYPLYNRGEGALIQGNLTNDPYLQNSFVNATLDMATPGAAGDDQIIVLYDDGGSSHGDASAGDKLFSNYFNFSESNQTGTWNSTIRAYDSSGMFLNLSSSTFNLSDQYSITAVVDNPLGLENRQVNATINVTNVRNDTYIVGAQLNCTYGAGPLTDITDYGNGTYHLNFTAPSQTGAYTLNCSATKYNNSGWGTDVFYTEAATTTANTTFSPESYNASNVTWYLSENFTLNVNITNAGNATARSANITLYLPPNVSGTSFSQCGNIGIGSFCVKPFNISVLNQTVPGTYRINVTTSWRNPDTSFGESNASFNITVLPNPKIEVLQSLVSGTVGDGQNLEIGSFNVTSFGNVNASNVTFSSSGLPASFIVTFTPPNISTIGPNKTDAVKVNVSVPPEYAPGTYNGSINASSVDGGWDNLTVQVIVPPNTTMTSSAIPASYFASNITWYSPENFTFTVNSTNTGNSYARYANITLYLPPQAAGPSFYACGNVSVSSSCAMSFNITILNQTPPGTYWINISTAWRNNDATGGESNTSFNITVLPNAEIEIPQSLVSGTVGDGQNLEIGSFNVTSFGNVNASNITFAVTGLPGSFAVTFNPVNISTIAPNATNEVNVSVSVPLMYAAGNYTGTINVSAENNGWDTIVLNVSVPENRSWTRSPSLCMGVEIGDTGTVCTVVINNTGNAPINFTISPPDANHTSVNETNFTLGYNATRYIAVSYDVSGNQKGYYNATYTIYANTSGTLPGNLSFDINMFPYLEPFMAFSSSSSTFGQNNSVTFFANITDRSGAGINWTAANVTAPSGEIFTVANMTLMGSSGNATSWSAVFPLDFSDTNQSRNSTPTTNERGVYNLTISSMDNSGAVGYLYSNFSVHRNMTVFLGTPYARFPEGDASCTVGEINYTANYFGDVPASGENVTLGIIAANNATWLMIPNQYTTYLDGKIYDNTGQAPSFRLCNSALAGNYTMISYTDFYDSASNETVRVQKNATFTVYPRPITIELVNPTFESTYLAFRVWVKDIFGANIEPDKMDFALYRDVFLSNGSVMSILDTSFNMSNSRVAKESTQAGPKYIVSLSGLSSTAQYWIRANATYGSRLGMSEKTFNPGVRTWYDVRMDMDSHETYPGEYLGFDLSIDNRAGGGQDVFVEYWVSNAGLEEKSWYSASLHTFVGTGVSLIIPLQAYIFPTQPYGNYWLYVRVTPTNDSSSQFSWQAHDSFVVLQKPPVPPVNPPPPPPIILPPPSTGGVVIIGRPGPSQPGTGGAIGGEGGAGGAAGEAKARALSIITYPRNISTVRGWTDISSIEVKSTGIAPVTNVTLSVTGIPSTWLSMRPNRTESISAGNVTVFLLEFKIPPSAGIGTYNITFTAVANEGRDEKTAELTVFSHVSDMILAEIRELKARLGNLREEAKVAESAGRNVTLVWPVLDNAGSEINLSEKSLANASYDDAQNHVLLAKNLLDRAEFLLASPEFAGISPASAIPWWLVILMIILALIASFAMLWTFRLKRKMNIFFKSPQIMTRIAQKLRHAKEERQSMLAEREKLVRMQSLLEKEVQDGTITEAAYQELKKRTAEKLAALGKKSK